MKVVAFTMLVPDDKSVISEHIKLPHFYQFLHRHDEWQITLVQEGEGVLIAGNNMQPFGPGDIFLIGAKLPHLFKSNPEYFQPDSGKAIRACSLYFNPSGVLSALFDLPEMRKAKSFLTKYRHGFKISQKLARDMASKIIDVHQSSGADVLGRFLKLLETLQASGDDIGPLCADTYSSKVTEHEGLRLSRIINFITENYNNQISLEDAANAAFMTPSAFCRYFKKHTGYTFVTFLNEVKINDACKSLISGKVKECISCVAYKAGFSSVTNFNRVFKNTIGLSPSEYIDTYEKLNRNDSL